MHTTRKDVEHVLDDHRQCVEDLHQRLASFDGVDKAKLASVLEKYRTATMQFHDDVLGCMN